MDTSKKYTQLEEENELLRLQLEEATDTINAIRSGQVDALVVKDANGAHQLFTLKTADQTYRLFIEKMSEGAVTINENGIILYSNSKFASMVDVQLSKVIGLPFSSFVPDESKDIFNEMFKNGWMGDHKAELNIKRGELLIPCQLSVASLELDEGVSLSVILTDLTFQKETETLLKSNNQKLKEINLELESSNHDLQQFASVASHDLQEPLRKILIFSSMLRTKHSEEFTDVAALHLQKIISSAHRMKTMIADVLSYSRLSTHVTVFEPTNLGDIVQEVIEDYEILIQEKKARIFVGKLPTIEVNRGQIRQVFQNLISNAIKFSKPDSTPVIHIDGQIGENGQVTSDSSAHCIITVKDNGIGFDEVYRDKIFSLFERLNTKDKYEGSGIGLAISKKIIDKHNGSITAVSQIGEGSQFTITLPLRKPLSKSQNRRAL